MADKFTGAHTITGTFSAFDQAIVVVNKIEVEMTQVGDLVRIENAWKCERCDHVFVGQYFSAEHCNETGEDLVLCEECCNDANAGREQVLQDQAAALVADVEQLKVVRDCGTCPSEAVERFGDLGLIKTTAMHFPSYGGQPLVYYGLTEAGIEFLAKAGTTESLQERTSVFANLILRDKLPPFRSMTEMRAQIGADDKPLKERVEALAGSCTQWAVNARAAAARGGALGRPDLSHGMAVTYDNCAALLRQLAKTAQGS
jgi:hypothetical protein